MSARDRMPARDRQRGRMHAEDRQNVERLRRLQADDRWSDEPYVQRARGTRRSWRSWLPVPIAAVATLAIAFGAVALTRPAASDADHGGAAATRAPAAPTAGPPTAAAPSTVASSDVVPWAPLAALPAGSPGSVAPGTDGPLDGLTATIDLPADVRAGATTDYTVRLTNPGSRTVALTPCPTYTQIVQGPPQSVANRPSGSRFRLNCAAVGSLAAGASVVFAMRATVPAEARGTTKVSWSLESPGAPSAVARASVTP